MPAKKKTLAEEVRCCIETFHHFLKQDFIPLKKQVAELDRKFAGQSDYVEALAKDVGRLREIAQSTHITLERIDEALFATDDNNAFGRQGIIVTIHGMCAGIKLLVKWVIPAMAALGSALGIIWYLAKHLPF